MQIKDVNGLEFSSAKMAIDYAAANRPVVIRVDGRILIVLKHEADRLTEEGVEFAYLTEYDGRIVTVPVN